MITRREVWGRASDRRSTSQFKLRPACTLSDIDRVAERFPRYIGVVVAAFVGWRWLGESFGGMRTVGDILIFAGILVIAVAG